MALGCLALVDMMLRLDTPLIHMMMPVMAQATSDGQVVTTVHTCVSALCVFAEPLASVEPLDSNKVRS